MLQLCLKSLKHIIALVVFRIILLFYPFHAFYMYFHAYSNKRMLLAEKTDNAVEIQWQWHVL